MTIWTIDILSGEFWCIMERLLSLESLMAHSRWQVCYPMCVGNEFAVKTAFLLLLPWYAYVFGNERRGDKDPKLEEWETGLPLCIANSRKAMTTEPDLGDYIKKSRRNTIFSINGLVSVGLKVSSWHCKAGPPDISEEIGAHWQPLAQL